MLRLQEGIRKAGVESRVMCVRPTQPDSVAIPRLRGEGWLRGLTSRLGLNELHPLGSLKIPGLTAFTQADLLHLHAIHGGFFNYLALPLVARKKPTVYTLHDMWPLTGHCVYSFDCDRWKSGCGRCPYPKAPEVIERDATWLEWRLKAWSYRRSNLTIVAPSTWIYGLARQSSLGHLPIHHIPHGLDTETYAPLDRDLCRAALGIPAGKRVILYVVRRMSGAKTTAHVKGVDVLVRAVKSLPASLRKEAVLLLMGHGSEAMTHDFDMAVMPLGFVTSDRLKVVAYSAADLFVFPSRAEAFGLVALESIACGTPVVSFGVGGVPDIVRPGVSGLLADPGNSKQLSTGIAQLLEDNDLRARLSEGSREIAVKEFNMDLYVNRHIALYQQVLNSVSP
jgi:glycosyltransferase involved in cell wall biosynthesis